MTPTETPSDALRSEAPSHSEFRSLSLITAAWRVVRVEPLHALRGRRLYGLILLAALPLIISLLQSAFGRPGILGMRGFVDLGLAFLLLLAAPMTMLFLGAGTVGDDIDDGTILYLRFRPIPRASIVLGRYLMIWMCGLVPIIPSIVLLYLIQVGSLGGGALAGHLPLLFGMCGIAVAITATYGAFFLLLSLLFRYSVVIGLGCIVLWDFVVALIPAPSARLTVSFHTGALLSRLTDEGKLLDFRLRAFEGTDLIPTASSSLIGLSAATCVFLVVASLIFARREYMEKPGQS